uniref:Colorectal mutant cancer protein n=1 Tax=Daphnia magna TaxID=35525 RepID=A0A0P4YFD7_9CRUS
MSKNHKLKNVSDLVPCNLHLTALGSLRGEIGELHARLQRAAQDRDTLEQALAKTQLERLRLVQESEERLERQSTQYEERLTELHSVIAELTRKLNRQQYNVIKEEGEEEETEEDEEEDDEDDVESEGEESNKGKRIHPEMKGSAKPDIEPEASTQNKRAEEVGYSLLDGQDATEDEPEAASSSCSSDLSFGASSSDEDGHGPAGEANQAGEDDLDAKAVQAGENLDQFLSSSAKETSAAIVDPLTSFSLENKELKVEILRLGQDLNQAHEAVDALRNERDELKRQLEMSQQPRPLPLSAAASMGALSSLQGSPVHQRFTSSRVSSPVVVEEGPVCKVAERVRIRRLDGREKLLTGSQIASFGIRDARVAEQLVCSVHQDSVQGEAHHSSGAEAVRVNELELEVERLASRSEHLRAQNDVLSLTLAESRALGERLAVLLGKYESNCMALRMALERADRVSEAFEVLAALVESEMSLLLANCQVAGLGLTGRGGSGWEAESSGNSKDLSVLWKRATERRRSAENLARSLLSKYDRDRDNWEDTGRHTNTTSSTSSGAESGSGSGSNPACTLEPTERKVRDIIGRLKGDRASLENTVQQVSLPLESVLVDPLPKDVLPLGEARKIDLEMAVIMQELMAMREERSRLRTQVYILEKERAAHEAQQQATTAQLRILHTSGISPEVSGEKPMPPTSGADGNDVTVREKRLQLKIQELTGALERVTTSAELRSQQSADLVSDVKKANAPTIGGPS